MPIEFDYGDAIADTAVLQPDGKIIVAGYTTWVNNKIGLARYNPDGSLDASFGKDGLVTTKLEGRGKETFSLALQPDGRIILGGAAEIMVEDESDLGNRWDIALARYHPDGSLDTSFGDNGLVTTDMGGNEGADRLLLQPDGKILVAGADFTQYLIVRYNPDGSLDPSFGSQGWVTARFPGLLLGNWDTSMVLQVDGKILIAKDMAINEKRGWDFALVRFNPDGSLDTSFGEDGLVMTDVEGQKNYISAMILQPDEKIVVGGKIRDGDFSDYSLARYFPDGRLDTSFGSDGIVITEIDTRNEYVHSLALQEDGKLLAAGVSTGYFTLARYNSDGSLDASFGEGGLALTPVGEISYMAVGKTVLVQPDGKIIVVGTFSDGSEIVFALARYHPDGSLDKVFGL